jgi:hypothetical protein
MWTTRCTSIPTVLGKYSAIWYTAWPVFLQIHSHDFRDSRASIRRCF